MIVFYESNNNRGGDGLVTFLFVLTCTASHQRPTSDEHLCLHTLIGMTTINRHFYFIIRFGQDSLGPVAIKPQIDDNSPVITHQVVEYKMRSIYGRSSAGNGNDFPKSVFK